MAASFGEAGEPSALGTQRSVERELTAVAAGAVRARARGSEATVWEIGLAVRLSLLSAKEQIVAML